MTVEFYVYIIHILFLIFNMHQLKVYTLLSEYTFVLNFNFIFIKQLVESGMHFIYTSQTILIGWRYGLNDTNKGHGISWEGVASLVKSAHRNGDTNLTHREINWAYGLKDKMASILINPSKSFILQITFWRTWFSFPCIAA